MFEYPSLPTGEIACVNETLVCTFELMTAKVLAAMMQYDQMV